MQRARAGQRADRARARRRARTAPGRRARRAATPRRVGVQLGRGELARGLDRAVQAGAALARRQHARVRPAERRRRRAGCRAASPAGRPRCATPSATSTFSRSAVPNAIDGLTVEHEPRRDRALGDVDAHVRLAGARGRVPVDLAHVVARRGTRGPARARCPRRPRACAGRRGRGPPGGGGPSGPARAGPPRGSVPGPTLPAARRLIAAPSARESSMCGIVDVLEHLGRAARRA